MKQILVFGAGRSGVYMVEYLKDYCADKGMRLVVCDKQTGYMESQVPASAHLDYRILDIENKEMVSNLVQASELVVSMLPAFLHMPVANLCLAHGRHLATASYISDDMKALNEQVRRKDLIFLNEMGLDPGIDHMSAMQMMDTIRKQGGKITGFRSYCGGLVADANDGDNPWKYKFSWNPRNVVLAAQGAPATYLEEGLVKVLPYQRVFENARLFQIPGYGALEAYPNRDSLKYLDVYGLHGVHNMVRGTFRKPGYCNAWQVFVCLGLTDDTLQLDLSEDITLTDWLRMYLPSSGADIRQQVQNISNCSTETLHKLEWLGFFSNQPLPLHKGTSAQILEELLKTKWKLEPEDKDLVVMLHEIEYMQNGKSHTHCASLVLEGHSNTHTAMAKTVGLPLAVGVKLILENRIAGRGVMTPVAEEVYKPVLEELARYSIVFNEWTA